MTPDKIAGFFFVVFFVLLLLFAFDEMDTGKGRDIFDEPKEDDDES